MAGAAGAIGPKNIELYIETGAALPTKGATPILEWAALVGAGNLVEDANKLGRIMEIGDIAETAEIISQGYYGDEEADTAAGLTSREAITVQVRAQFETALYEEMRDLALGNTVLVAISYKVTPTAWTILAFVAQLGGRTAAQPSGGLANTTLSLAPQGGLRWADQAV